MIGKIMNTEMPDEPGTPLPGYTPELGDRISSVIRALGGLKKSARFAGVTDETLAAWRDGKREPRFFGLLGLARAAGTSLEWLATGFQPPSAPLDEDLLAMIVEQLDLFQAERNLSWRPQTRARLIALGYSMMLAERERGLECNAESLHFIFRAAL